jgi:micrococcal nuclease
MRYIVGIAALAIMAGLVANKVAPTEASTTTVTEVIDGDTIKVGTETVRLIGIDTPESVKPGMRVECGAKQASAFVKALATGRHVRLVTDPTQDRRDRYGRLLAYVDLEDGTSVQERVLRAGWASVYVYDHRPFRRLRTFTDASDAARAAHRGVYGHCGGDFHGAA